MILAELAEKYFKLCTNNECPIAVVNKARRITYGYCVVIFAVSMVNITGNSMMESTIS